MNSPVARAWVAAQDPELISAFRAVFCGCEGLCVRGHLRKEQRDLISAWVTRTVMRGYVSVVREPGRSRKGWEDKGQRQRREGVVFREVFGQVIALPTPKARPPRRKGAA